MVRYLVEKELVQKVNPSWKDSRERIDILNSLLILGFGGHGKVVAETVLLTKKYKKIVFLDDTFDQSNPQSEFLNCPLIGPLSDSLNNEKIFLNYSSAVVAIGNSSLRLKWLKKLQKSKYKLPIIIHPKSYIASSAQIEPGTVVFANSVIQSNARIGFGSIVNTSSSIDHDSVIAEGVHICPGAHLAGEVNVGARSQIGIGASIVQKITIGSDVIVGAGASVINNFQDKLTVVGVPAQPISINN